MVQKKHVKSLEKTVFLVGNGLESGVLRSEGYFGTKRVTLLAQRARAPVQKKVLRPLDPGQKLC